MRATATCIRGCKTTKKRKATEDTELQNKMLYLVRSSNDNLEIDPEQMDIVEGSEKFDDTLSINSQFLSPTLSITKNYIETAINTIKKSIKGIFPISSLLRESLPIFVNSGSINKTLHVGNPVYKKRLTNAKRTLFYTSINKRPFSIGSVMTISPSLMSSIQLKPKLRINEDEEINGRLHRNLGSDKSCIVSLPGLLDEYLKQRKSNLFRSRTENFLSKHAVVNYRDIEKFCRLVEEDPAISLFIKRDICRRYADKYLLSMIFAYFVRSQLDHKNYNRENFFAALYLAHDMEEEDDDLKYEVFPYCLGPTWRNCYAYLLSLRDDLFWAVNCRAVVSKKCCEQIMGLMPNHWMWQRERPEYHADIVRDVQVQQAFPKGPYGSPIWCRACLERECYDSENSYIVYSSLSDFSADDENSDNDKPKKDSGFESFLMEQNEVNDKYEEEKVDSNNNRLSVEP